VFGSRIKMEGKNFLQRKTLFAFSKSVVHDNGLNKFSAHKLGSLLKSHGLFGCGCYIGKARLPLENKARLPIENY